MPSQPRTAAPRGFHCEHAPGESRVLALVEHPSGPPSLHPVLTCRSPELAHRAARMLQRAAHVPSGEWDFGQLEEVCARLPEASAAALRTATGHALAGTWPVAAGSVLEWDEIPGAAPSDRRADADARDDADADARDSAGAGAGAGAPGGVVDGGGSVRRSPRDPRLADLSGPVFRIALLREFHVHDRQALLKAAADQGWEPLPAHERGGHDRDDLIGATMWLAEHRGEIAGADTLADRCQAYRLSAEAGDEVAGWSGEATVADFGSGWLRPAYGDRAGSSGEPGRATRRPDFAELFAVDDPHCTDPECEDERCAWQLTPRTAAALHEALGLLAGSAHDDAEEFGDRPLTPGGSDENAGVLARLPKVTYHAGLEWRLRFARAVEDIRGDLENGWWPEPTCTAEEIALHLAVEDARTAVGDARTATGRHGARGLPAHRDDHDFDTCEELLFQDTDVLMLYDAGLDGIEDPDGEINVRLGIGDLRPAAWFEPFLNVTPRDSGSGPGAG